MYRLRTLSLVIDSGTGPAPAIIWWSCRVESVEEHDTLHNCHSLFIFPQAGYSTFSLHIHSYHRSLLHEHVYLERIRSQITARDAARVSGQAVARASDSKTGIAHHLSHPTKG
eukprot:6212544-Pleurochrysis_carterae.AAC.3